MPQPDPQPVPLSAEELFQRAARVPCPECGGKKRIHTGYPSPDPDEATKRCPSCRDGDRPTGYWAWELTEWCPDPECGTPRTCFECGDEHCPWCCGTRRVLKSGEALQVAGLSFMLRQGYDVRFAPDRANNEAHQIYHVLCTKPGGKPLVRGSGPTPDEALAAAIAAVLGVENGNGV